MFNINKVIDVLLIRIPVIKSYLKNISIEEDNSIDTAATNGCTIFYNKDYLKELTLEEQVFVLAHEFFHIILKHRIRENDKDHDAWNYATDAVINQMLKIMGLKLPEGIIECEDAFGKSSEEYYEYIKNRPDFDELMNQYKKNQKCRTFIPHKECPKKENQEENQKEKQVDKTEELNSLPDITEDEIINENNELINKENQEYLDKFNSKSDSKEVNITNIGKSKPTINWIDFLNYKKRKSKNSNYDFYSGEFDEEGIYYYPFKQSDESEVEVLIDTSGSVDEELVKSFLRECKNIFSESTLKVGCFDDEFYGFTKIKRAEELDNFKIIGRGGTDFDVAIDSFTPKKNIKIIFTDGASHMLKKAFNCTWLVYSDLQINPPGGTVFNIDSLTLKASKNKKI